MSLFEVPKFKCTLRNLEKLTKLQLIKYPHVFHCIFHILFVILMAYFSGVWFYFFYLFFYIKYSMKKKRYCDFKKLIYFQMGEDQPMNCGVCTAVSIDPS